jgi:hypothetical protein
MAAGGTGQEDVGLMLRSKRSNGKSSISFPPETTQAAENEGLASKLTRVVLRNVVWEILHSVAEILVPSIF